MKKILATLLIMFSSFSFADLNEVLEKERLKREQYQEQERLQKELESRNESFQNLKFEEIKDVENTNEIKFHISHINLKDDKKLLNEIEKERILSKYIDKNLGGTDLTNLLAELTNRLIAKGYITTTANITQDNDLSTGVLNLEILYGKIEKITLNNDTNLDNLKKFFLVKAKEGEVLNLRDLDTTTDNFNYLEANRMTMEIKPSEIEQHSVVELKNEMQDKFTLSMFTNNHGEDRQNGIWRFCQFR